MEGAKYPQRLPWSQRICFSLGHSLNDFCASMWFSYLIVYLQLVLGFDSNYAGLVLLIGQVADAVATPILGYEASSKKNSGLCGRYGKRKMLHLVGTVCVVMSFPFIFSVCPGCEKASEGALTFMLIPLVIIFQVGWAAVQVSHLSLIPVITPHESERDFLNVLRYTVNVMSDIGTYVIVWCVFDLTRKPIGNHNTITGDYANKFMVIVVIAVGVGSFFSILFHIGVREVEYSSALSSEENSLEKIKEATKTPLVAVPSLMTTITWKGWLKEGHFYQIGLLYMCCRLYQNMSSVFMPLYLQESLRADDDFIAKIPLVMNISGFAISCALPKFFKVFSKKVTFLGGACAGMGACIWITLGSGPSYSAHGIYGVGALLGGASSVMVVCALSFIHDLIGTSAESGAFVYGCMSFWDKLANGIVGMLIQHVHAVSCVSCDWFYAHVMSYGVGGVAIAASIVMMTLLPANLGQRQSAYNGAGKSSTDATDNNKKEESVDEKKPLLEKSS